MSSIYDDMRKAIAASELSRYRIAKKTGIGEPQLCQFMAGTKGLSVEALEELAECLGMVIKARPKKRGRSKVRATANLNKRSR